MLHDLRYVRNFLALNYTYNFLFMKNVLISIGGDCNSNISNHNLDFEQIIAVDSGDKAYFQSLIRTKYSSGRYGLNF
jgi:hypothetical protein